MKRSNLQNNGYWLVVEQCREHYANNNAALIIDVLKAMKVANTKDFTHRVLKALLLPNNKTSSTQLETDEMSDYMMSIKAHFATEHKVDILLPNETPLEELTKKEGK